MTKAEEFKAIASDARKKTTAQLRYERLLNDIKEAAEDGKSAIPLRKFTVEGIKYANQVMPVSDEEAKAAYDDQEALYDCFRENGFVVRETDVEMPSTLDISMPEHVRQQIEMTKRMIEKDVYIIWDEGDFDKESEHESGIILN